MSQQRRYTHQPVTRKKSLDIKVSRLDDEFGSRSPPINYQQFENFLSVQKPNTHRDLQEDETLMLDPQTSRKSFFNPEEEVNYSPRKTAEQKMGTRRGTVQQKQGPRGSSQGFQEFQSPYMLSGGGAKDNRQTYHHNRPAAQNLEYSNNQHRYSMIHLGNPNASIWGVKDQNKNKCRGFDDSKNADISQQNAIWPETNQVKDFMEELQEMQRNGGAQTDVSQFYPPPRMNQRQRSRTRQIQPQPYVKSGFEFEIQSPKTEYRPRNKSKTIKGKSLSQRNSLSPSPVRGNINNVDEIDLLPDLPERLDDMDMFLKDDEMDKIFRDGLERFKDVYIDHQKKLQIAFLNRYNKLKEMKRKIKANHAYTRSHAQRMYQKLQVFRQSILQEKIEWEKQRNQVQKPYYERQPHQYDEIVSLDVGGTHKIRTSVEILTRAEGSLLAKMFRNKEMMQKNSEGDIFLDRDGKTFLNVVNYLRNERQTMPVFDNKHSEDLFIKELEFWGLHDDLRKLRQKNEKNVSPVRKNFKEGRKSSMQPQIYPQRSLKEQAAALNQESQAPRRKLLGKPGAFVNRRSQSPPKRHNPPAEKPVNITSSKQALEFYTKIPEPVMKMLMSEPIDASPVVRLKWRVLGPLNIYEIEAKNPGSFVTKKTLELKFGQSSDCDFLNGQLDENQRVQGIGRTIFPSGNVHEGQYKDDKRHGFGRFIWSDGAYYIGMWTHGMRDGLGTFLHADGTEEQGIWSSGQLVKEMEISPTKETPQETPDNDDEYSVNGEWAHQCENEKHKQVKTS